MYNVIRKTLGILLVAGMLGSTLVYADNPFGVDLPKSIDDFGAIAYEDPSSGFTFKKAYSAFFFQGHHAYDDPRLGYSLAYASPTQTSISVYVYNYGLEDIPTGTESNLVENQLISSVKGIRDSGRYLQVSEEVRPALSPHFLQSFQKITLNQGDTLKSYMLLRGERGHFVKVRVTGYSEALERRVADFLHYMLQDLGAIQGP